jgi:hypothetical protein
MATVSTWQAANQAARACRAVVKSLPCPVLAGRGQGAKPKGAEDAHCGVGGAFGHGRIALGVADVESGGVMIDLRQSVQLRRLGLGGLPFRRAG